MMTSNKYHRLLIAWVLITVMLVAVGSLAGQSDRFRSTETSSLGLARKLGELRQKLHQQLQPYSYRVPDPRSKVVNSFNNSTNVGVRYPTSRVEQKIRSDFHAVPIIRQAQYQSNVIDNNNYARPNDSVIENRENSFGHPMGQGARHDTPQRIPATRYGSRSGAVTDIVTQPMLPPGFFVQPTIDPRFQRYSNQITASERVIQLTDELSRVNQLNRSLSAENQLLQQELQQNQKLLVEVTHSVNDSIEKLNEASKMNQSLTETVIQLKAELAAQKAESSKLLNDIRGQLNALIAQELPNGK